MGIRVDGGAGAVASVAGKTGVVSLALADITSGFGAGIAALLAATSNGNGNKLVTCIQSSTGNITTSGTSGTISLPVGTSLVFLTEQNGIGSTAKLCVAGNNASFCGISVLGSVTTSGSGNFVSVNPVSSGFTITVGALTATNSYTVTIITMS
jgi:hypothetical protein